MLDCFAFNLMIEAKFFRDLPSLINHDDLVDTICGCILAVLDNHLTFCIIFVDVAILEPLSIVDLSVNFETNIILVSKLSSGEELPSNIRPLVHDIVFVQSIEILIMSGKGKIVVSFSHSKEMSCVTMIKWRLYDLHISWL